MLKHIQTKLILIYLAIGLIIILGLGATFFTALYHLQTELNLQTIQNQTEISQLLMTQIQQTQFALIIIILVFCIIMALVGFYVSRSIIAPIQKLVKSAEKIAKGEEIPEKEIVQKR